MDFINTFFEFLFPFYIIITSVAFVLVFPILFFWKKVKPTLTNKKQYSQLAQKIYFDVDVYFKRFDIFNAKTYLNPFKLDTYSTAFNNSYEFYKADILVLETSILVFSKHNILGFKFNCFSFKINFENNNKLLSSYDLLNVEYLSVNLKDRDLEIEFNDYNYKKSIVLVIKKIGSDISDYLKTENIKNINSSKNNILKS